MSRKYITFAEIIFMAMLAVVNAVLTVLLSFVNITFTAIGGPMLTSTIVGIYMLYGVLAIYIIRKPGAALITYGMGAFLQIMLGISYGVAAAVIAAACYAIAVEGYFAIFRYKRWGYTHLILASLIATALWFAFAANMFGYTAWSIWILAIALVIRFLSGIVFCGLFSKWIGDQLAKTGMLNRFTIGKTRPKL